MNDNRVLVLGGSYFIGKKIVQILSEGDYQVTTLNRGTVENPFTNLDHIKCDRNDAVAMQSALKGRQFDIVIDVSGTTKEQMQIVGDSLDKTSLKKYIFISSSSVYAVHKCIPPYHVGDSMGENEYWGDYGKNKAEAELFLYNYYDAISKISLVVLRPPYVYGEGNYAQRESFVFHHTLNDRPVLIPGGGDTKIQFIYVTDLANIVKHFCDKPCAKTLTLNVGNKLPITFNKWVALCAEATGKKASTIHIDYKRHNYAVRDFFPFHNYTNVLATDPIFVIYKGVETPFQEGLKNAFEWYQANVDTIQFKPHITANENRIIEELGAPLN